MSAAGRILKVIVMIAVLLPVLGLGSCALVLWAGTVNRHWNQKMNVTVRTPSGEVSGASVVRVDWQGTQGMYAHIFRSNDGAGSSWQVTGEAVAVKVLPGRWLFALLKGESGNGVGDAGRNLASMIAMPAGVPYSTVEAMKLVRAFPDGETLTLSPKAFVGTTATPSSTLPLLVTFDDISDPITVRKVNPRDLAATFGPGVSLTAITVEKTAERVTEGRVGKLLGWLGPYPEPALGPSTGGDLATSPFYLQVNIGDFTRRPQ